MPEDNIIPPQFIPGMVDFPSLPPPLDLPFLPPVPSFLPDQLMVRSNTDPPGLLSAMLDEKEQEASIEGSPGIPADEHLPAISPSAQSGPGREPQPEIPTATALELIEAVNPEEATKLDFGEALTALDQYAKGQNSDEHARAKFRAEVHAAFRVGLWTVILTLPIIVWPMAEHLQDVSTRQREYFKYWGSMLLQFLFCIGSTFGQSAKYTMEGWLGTVLATLNMLLLNNIFGPWLEGGAYRNSLEYFDNSTETFIVTSRWLPLCNTAADLSFNNCYMNLNTALAAKAEYGKAILVFVDYVLFVFLVLTLGFNTNVRVFSISTHAFFVMSFLDPSTGSFDLQPSLASNYFMIVSGASIGVLFCFLLPTPITSTSKVPTRKKQIYFCYYLFALFTPK